MPEDDWSFFKRTRHGRPDAGISPVRVAMLFGSAAIALALIVASYLGDDRDRNLASNRSIGVDTMTTGSIGGKAPYIIRRSVLQSSPNATCVIKADGTRSGDC